MANRRTHSLIGAAAGGATALYLARAQEAPLRLVEAVGGLIGGVAGGRLPDILEPAQDPWHRSVAHALVPAGVVGRTFVPRIPRAQQHIRAWADRCRVQSEAATNNRDRIIFLLAEMACRFAAGAMAGIAGGYASHLLLDADTPRGLPLLA